MTTSLFREIDFSIVENVRIYNFEMHTLSESLNAMSYRLPMVFKSPSGHNITHVIQVVNPGLMNFKD